MPTTKLTANQRDLMLAIAAAGELPEHQAGHSGIANSLTFGRTRRKLPALVKWLYETPVDGPDEGKHLNLRLILTDEGRAALEET